ncbi:hypothetical protein FMM05_07045 [Flavobacterium zepuense]|uniref:Uncharacterized protein n=1 Tax=Flavobacterium zepuense TaxID=2593302 RepID=A0A552V692_9FLAO|nr:hypothetical protein [Flavobacterium zepuense]TRW25971.1 hypothetical protein FMM05_07045 [Flavobacterium zepuense]
METNGKNSQIEKEALQLVLEEFTQEQKISNQNIGELIIAVTNVGNKIDEFRKEQEMHKAVPAVTDTKPVEAILQKGFLDIKYMIGTQPKNILRKFQILLFPEQNHKLFYKIVFGRWFLMLVIMFVIARVYEWGIHYSDNQKEIEIQQIENDRIKKAWVYMYYNNGKDIKKVMDKAYINSEKDTKK